jgi:hypothetical protein
MKQGRRFAARQNEGVERLDLARRPDFDRSRHRRDVSREIALEGEDTDRHVDISRECRIEN